MLRFKLTSIFCISTTGCRRARSDDLRTGATQRALAQTVLEGKRPRLAGYEFVAVMFRSVSGDAVEAVLGIDRRLRPARPLRAFVGHRFTSGVTNNLRHNLQLLCRPYGVSLWYSDTDMPKRLCFRDHRRADPPK